ncbi:MAG TPA: protease complex subunit PrcB family protein [Gammaproteobacteria bacterium]|nr:protease complex subunit PrcB family protein [Gammaproteobacteria bacterium]
MMHHLLRAGAAGVAACLMTACAAAPGDSAANPSVPFEVVLSGRHSGVYKQYFTVIRDSETFASVWRRATARQYPQPAPPAIDFSRSMVIAVFLGERRSGGYQIGVGALTPTSNGLQVTVRETRPGAGCNTTQALTEPFEIIKTAADAAPVHFRKLIVTTSCD